MLQHENKKMAFMRTKKFLKQSETGEAGRGTDGERNDTRITLINVNN